MNDSSKKHKENQIEARSRIDSSAQILEPIDFSFKDIMNFDELKDLQPRFTDKKSEPKRRDGKYISLSLKLGYNALTDINGLYDWCSLNFLKPNEICSLDLSFNCFSNIPMELLKFSGLKVLYLHGNKINDLTEVDKLIKLTNLTILAIHGNPVENLAGFRFYILSKFPLLKHLNFSGVSRAERETAQVWVRTNKQPLKLEDANKKTIKRSKVEDD